MEKPRPTQREIIIKQVGKQKLIKAENIANVSENACFKWEMRNTPHPSTEEQTEIRKIAKNYGIQEGEHYLWPKRILNVENAWNESIIEDIDRKTGKLPKKEQETEIAAIKIESMLKKAAFNNPESPWDPHTRYNYIVKAGTEAAQRGLTELALAATEMLPGYGYQKGIIAAMIGDDEIANKVVKNLLESTARVKVAKARMAAEIGRLINDRGIIFYAIEKIEHQKKYFSAAELALEYNEPEIARGHIPTMMKKHQYLPAGKIAFKLGDLLSVNAAIEALIQDEKFRSALELIALTGDKNAAIKVWELLDKAPDDPKSKKLMGTALKIFFDENI